MKLWRSIIIIYINNNSNAGLFHKAISQSGTALVPWAESQPGEAIRRAKKLAVLMGCPEKPSNVFLDCLRTKNSYDLIGTEYNFYVSSKINLF